MLAVYNLRTRDLLDQHFESVATLLAGSDHLSVFKNLEADALEERLHALVENNGLILKATYGQAAAGILIAEIRHANEFGVLELGIDPDAENRTIDILFEQCRRELTRRKYRAIYCNHDWFASVRDKNIRDKFLNRP